MTNKQISMALRQGHYLLVKRWHGNCLLLENKNRMKGKYFVAAGLAVAGLIGYYFFRKRTTQTPVQPHKENERHHLTNAFSKAKQMAINRS